MWNLKKQNKLNHPAHKIEVVNRTKNVGLYPFVFTGKERDAETGYYYHGARFNSSDIGWLSVDPMADKYPEITPYHYCHWNPIKLVDPTGEFDYKIHERMVREAFTKSGSTFTIEQQNLIVKGTGWYSDWNLRKDNSIHMDNYYPTKKVSQLSNYQNIVNRYNEAVSNYQNKISNENYHDAGIELHTIADFYSHSNYIELFDKYMNGKEFTADDIPTFSEVLNNPQYSGFIDILQAELHTGKYQNWIFEQVTSKDNSHKYMNHDNDKSISGRSEYHGTTGYDAAYKVALKDIINIMENKNE